MTPDRYLWLQEHQRAIAGCGHTRYSEVAA